MELTDEELMMLEQLTYCSKFDGDKGETIGEILRYYDEDRLKKLEMDKDTSGKSASGSEWASIIRYLKTSKMKDLILDSEMKDNSGNKLAYCFKDPNDRNKAIVTFKGTSGGAEWKDNVEGLNQSDTECQTKALEYIEDLKYGDITVVGHSKGGNKAMYVTITSDKVSRCISMDGQGFSQEFLNKYWAEVDQKGEKIKNYSVSTDYVHALLFQIPNSNQVFCKGYQMGGDIRTPARHHVPSSYFQTDNNGKLIIDSKGLPQITTGLIEDKSVGMLHDFTTFILNNAPEDDKSKIIDYIGDLLPILFKNPSPTEDEIKQYVLGDTDSLALVVAYLIKYMDEYDLDSKDIDKLLSMLKIEGKDNLNSLVTINGKKIPLAQIFDFLKKQLLDGNNDRITKYGLKKILKGQLGNINIEALWDKIENNIKRIKIKNKTGLPTEKNGKIRDFSANVYKTIETVINQINQSTLSVSNWRRYMNEEWYDFFSTGIAVEGINKYFTKLDATNRDCKVRIDKVFNDIQYVDGKSGKKYKKSNSELLIIKNRIINLSDQIG